MLNPALLFSDLVMVVLVELISKKEEIMSSSPLEDKGREGKGINACCLLWVTWFTLGTFDIGFNLILLTIPWEKSYYPYFFHLFLKLA